MLMLSLLFLISVFLFNSYYHIFFILLPLQFVDMQSVPREEELEHRPGLVLSPIVHSGQAGFLETGENLLLHLRKCET